MKYNAFTIFSTVLILVSATPFFLLGNTVTGFLIATGLYLLSFFGYINVNPVSLTRGKLKIVLVTLLLFIYLALPFRSHDSFLFVNIWMLIFISFLFIRDEDLLNIVRCLSDTFYIICLGALAVLVLKAIGIDVPSWEFRPETSDIKKSIYYVYPGTAELMYQDYSIFGRTLFRVSGIFSEPGHFGVICASILYLNPTLLSKRKRGVMLITGLLSLSMGFYVLMVVFMLLRSKFDFRQVVGLLVSIVTIVLIFSLLPEEFLFRFFGNKIGNESDILDARTSMEFSLFYERILYTKEWLIGVGSNALSDFNVTASDYRAFIVKFGALGIVVYLFWFFSLRDRNVQLRSLFIAFSYFAIVFIHRSWFVGYLIFFFMNYMIVKSYSNKQTTKKVI